MIHAPSGRCRPRGVLQTGVLVVLFAFLTIMPRDARAGADNALGMALMGASVDQNAELVRGSGVTSVERTETGEYRVVFERSVATCHCTASAGGVGGTHFPLSTAAAGCPFGSSDTVVVTTIQDGIPRNLPFHLIVFCPK